MGVPGVLCATEHSPYTCLSENAISYVVLLRPPINNNQKEERATGRLHPLVSVSYESEGFPETRIKGPFFCSEVIVSGTWTLRLSGQFLKYLEDA